MTAEKGSILFIGYDYHSYTRSINAEFEQLGFQSRFHSIQPGNLYLKIARRSSSKLYATLLDHYHRRIILSYAEGAFDHIVFLQVHQFSHENMALLKARQPRARYTLYNWDAITTHDYRPYIGYFDRVLTFDPSDAKTLGIYYLPLFCVRGFQKLRSVPQTDSSVYFVGNIVNPKRYEVIKAFQAFCVREGIRFEYFLSTTVHGWTQMRKANLRPDDVSFQSIKEQAFRSMITRSAAVLDFANHQQSGFTMRIMENLCAGKKLITNNANALTASFYSPDRILVYSGEDFSAVKNFLDTPLTDPKKDFSEYHIQSFAKNLLGLSTLDKPAANPLLP